MWCFNSVRLAIRGVWRQVTGYNAMRRKRIAARLVERELDEAEKSLEWLADNTTGLERVRCVNDLFWLRSKRL